MFSRTFLLLLITEKIMKKKLLVLLIAVIPTLMPNLASAIAIDVEDCRGVSDRGDCLCLHWIDMWLSVWIDCSLMLTGD